MSSYLWVGTRKGLFELKREGDRWQVVGRHFLGQAVSALLPKEGCCTVALNLGHFGPKLWYRPAGDAAWVERPCPSFPPKPADSTDSTPWSVQQVWCLESDPGGRLWAGTIPGALFHSDDGQTWQLNSSLWDRPERSRWFGGGYDHPGIHSIAIDPRDGRRLWVAVSCGGIWYSADGGLSWEVRSAGMQADFMPPEQRGDPVIQDVHCLQLCAAAPDVLWVQHHNARYRSADAGQSWQDISAGPLSAFGFAVAAHPADPNCAWFVPAVKDEFRYPVDARLQVLISRDAGQTFAQLRQGLPQQESYDLVYRHALACDSSGTQLAFASTTGGLWYSFDGGTRFAALELRLPPVTALRFAA